MRTLDEHLCSDKQCEKLIELGFEEEYTISLYYELSYLTSRKDGILRSQALDFFRDKGWDFQIGSHLNKGYWFACSINSYGYTFHNFIKEYPEAESTLIDKLIEIQMGVQNGK